MLWLWICMNGVWAQSFDDAYDDKEATDEKLDSVSEGELELVLRLEECKKHPSTKECQEFFIQYGEELGVDLEQYLITDESKWETQMVEQETIVDPIEEPVQTPRVYKPYRISIGYTGGAFGYQQVPTSTDGLLYQTAITFNGQTEGSSSALTAGLDLRAVGVIPSMDFLGFDMHIQSDQYSIALKEFPEPIGDWMSSIDGMVCGRWSLSKSGWTMKPSVRAGLLRDDLIVFRQDIQDDGNVALSYEPLFVTAMNLGLGTELQNDTGLFAYVTYDLGIKGSIYRIKLDSQIGYDINELFFGFIGIRSTKRAIDIETSSGKAGEINDQNSSIVIGVGIR